MANFLKSLATVSLTLLLAGLCNTGMADSDLVWRDLRLKLISVERNAPDNPRDDTATFTARTATMSTRLTIPVLRSEFIDEYEIYVWSIRPDEGNSGAGSARVTVYGGR